MMVRLLLDRGAQIDAKTKVVYGISSVMHALMPPPSVILPADVLIPVSYVTY